MFRTTQLGLMFVFLLFVSISVHAIGEETTTVGRIAFVGADFNIYSYDPITATQTALTTNATALRRYQWPTWSRGQELAYFCCDARVSGNPLAEVFVSGDGIREGESIYQSLSENILYAYWAPTACEGTPCRNLAVLINRFDGNPLAVTLINYRAQDTTFTSIESGSPFYYHWNPDSTQLIFHRNNVDIDIYDLASDSLSPVSDEPISRAFQAPAWSPIDNRVLFGIEGSTANSTDIIVQDGDLRVTIAQNLRGFVSFLWSPDGRYIAYRTFDRSGISEINIVDAVTGARAGSSTVAGALAFFWSPDSTRIAYITVFEHEGRRAKELPIQQNVYNFVWNVLEIQTGINHIYSVFIPTYETQYLISYFDQFAPSHSIWSPDSRYITYSGFENTDSDQPSIFIQDTLQPDQLPTKIADGNFAVWSFE